MRRNKFASGQDDHVSMRDVLDAIDTRVPDVANAIVSDALNREQDFGVAAQMGQGMSGGLGMGMGRPMMGDMGIPPTLSQEYLQFVDGTDEVPEWFRRKYWGIITRMNQLTQVRDAREQNRIEASIRAMMRPFLWKSRVSTEEWTMVMHYTKTQILKARGGTERRLIAPQLTEITRKEEYTDTSVLSRNQQHPGMIKGAIDGIFNR